MSAHNKWYRHIIQYVLRSCLTIYVNRRPHVKLKHWRKLTLHFYHTNVRCEIKWFFWCSHAWCFFFSIALIFVVLRALGKKNSVDLWTLNKDLSQSNLMYKFNHTLVKIKRKLTYLKLWLAAVLFSLEHFLHPRVCSVDVLNVSQNVQILWMLFIWLNFNSYFRCFHWIHRIHFK